MFMTLSCPLPLQLSEDTLMRMYQQMVTLRLMDQHLYKAQRMVNKHAV